ncbi:hypothetical protein LJE86_06960 [bacterium BMS3Abin03]|jgi:hypothetical protein|nr:hypothetical protein [bacterium BMS3Abin03]MCG6960236.1 hypothetical protein [bacterium BMS3Abin03]
MAKNNKKNKPRQIGRTKIEKKPLIDPKYKNTFWTIVILVILTIFFIINNTRDVPDEGPYPPGYHPAKMETDSTN